MRILVTGSSHVAARLAASVLKAGHEVLTVDVAPHPVDGLPGHRCADLRDADLGALLQGVDRVLHFAPLTTPFREEADNLDHATRGTYRLLRAALAAGVPRVVVGSTLNLFAALPAGYAVGPSWRPYPRPTVPDLCAWLAECLARERARDASARFTCVRVGTALSEGDLARLVETVRQVPEPGWEVLHLGAWGERNPSAAQALSRAPRPKRAGRVVIFGAGGPLAAAVAQELRQQHHLRLTDAAPLEHIVATRPPQSPGAPRPALLPAPHEHGVVDITDGEAVRRASADMDAVVNCAVARHDESAAFRVNVVGAYHVMRAAVHHGIRRVVQTGPYQVGRGGAAGLHWDAPLVDDVPARPGGPLDLYFSTKLLGQEICRIFAQAHDLEVPNLLFCNFAGREYVPFDPASSFLTTWTDAARAVRAALTVPLAPGLETLHINGDTPHGVFPNDKARRVLGWTPQDDLSAAWTGPQEQL